MGNAICDIPMTRAPPRVGSNNVDKKRIREDSNEIIRSAEGFFISTSPLPHMLANSIQGCYRYGVAFACSEIFFAVRFPREVIKLRGRRYLLPHGTESVNLLTHAALRRAL